MAMLPPIPAQYTAFLAAHGAFEGFTTGEGRPGYVALWPMAEINGNNADIQVQDYAPGFVAFAGDGGGEVLAFDASGAVFLLPMVGVEPQYAIKIADSFAELEARFEIAS